MYPPPPPLHKAAHRRRCRDYLIALEEERRKIQVFQRELPLCLDLVTQSTLSRSHLTWFSQGSAPQLALVIRSELSPMSIHSCSY